jgi:protein O-GlcNAc transferase
MSPVSSQSEINSVITLFSSGQFQEALDKLTILTKENPNDSLLHNIAGACYAGLGQLDAAVKSYEKAIALNSDYAKAHFNLGGALHELGQLDEAVQSYESSIAIESDYAEAHNNLGNVLRELGQMDDAIDSYEKALVIKPNYVEALYSISLVLQHLGRIESMVDHLEKALTLKPDFAEAHNNLGIALKSLGQLDAAVISYQKAIAIKPDYAEAHNNLGNVFKDLGQLDDAVQSFQKALAINPNYPTLHNNLGIAFKELGQLDKAVKCYKKALIINPDFHDSHNNLGVVFNELGQKDEAVKSFKRAIAINPNYAEAYNNLGTALKDLGQLDDAILAYEKALSINPDYTDSYNNLGIVLKKLGRLDDALDSYEKALRINPGDADTHNNLGIVLGELERLDEAAQSYEKALALNPDYAEAYNNLAIIFMKLGRLDDAYKSNEKALILKTEFAEGYAVQGRILTELGKLDDALVSYDRVEVINPCLAYNLGAILNTKMRLCQWDNLPSLLSKLTKKINNNEKVIVPFDLLGLIDDPELQGKASEIYANEEFPKNDSLPNIGLYPKHKKIRVGYFSADFKLHPVATLTAELYEIHDRDHFEIHAFSFGPDTKDEMNLRIKEGVDHFHDVRLMSNKEITVFARSFEIDIAVDLGGYTADSRTGIFAMSVAPIQASYIGVLATMGGNYYDYLVAGQTMIPDKNQKYFVEKIIYLPSYQVNDSKESPPEVFFTRQDLGLPEKGFVFCCFNNTYKITPTTFDSWARILKCVDKSILLIIVDNESAKENLTKEITLRGVKPERLIFGERLARPEYLARYRVADLFLDTSPYNAGTTASDALRMGLPVLTLKGNSFNSREAASVIGSLNMPELITTSQKEYESLAIELATDLEKLKIIKDKLLGNLSTAPLYDTPKFTKNLESAYSEMYDRYQKGLDPDHIYVEQ